MPQPEPIAMPLLDAFITEIIDPIMILLMMGAFVVFLYGVVEMIFKADNDEAKITGRKHMLWGIIGLFIIISSIGIISIIQNTTGSEVQIDYEPPF